MQYIKIFSPATIANLSCGFDVLGMCIENAGDEMVFTKTKKLGVVISKIIGAELPYEIEKNVAGVVAKAMLENSNADFGIDIQIYKKIKPGSGIGSSAASAAGTAFAVNKLLNNIYTPIQVIEFAMIGEKLVGGALVADNVAPAILGGITLIKSYEPFEVISLPTPSNLYAVVAHPQVELNTRDSRRILKKDVPMGNAIKQWANLGAFVHALHTQNYQLLGSSLQDFVVEPSRKLLIPLFDETLQIGKKNGSLGGGISGAGPSIFNLCEGEKNAQNVTQSIQKLFSDNEIDCNVICSPINQKGVHVIEEK